MNVEQRESGLLVAIDKPTPPPEHPARQVIRDGLAKIASDLEEFEMTCHGHCGPHTIEGVARALVRCYLEPGAYEISDLAQVIDGLVEGQP